MFNNHLSNIINMEKPFYSVFYQSLDVFFVCRTDFNELEQADKFITSQEFIFDGAKFHFILKDGKKLIKREPMDRTENSIRIR